MSKTGNLHLDSSLTYESAACLVLRMTLESGKQSHGLRRASEEPQPRGGPCRRLTVEWGRGEAERAGIQGRSL